MATRNRSSRVLQGAVLIGLAGCGKPGEPAAPAENAQQPPAAIPGGSTLPAITPPQEDGKFTPQVLSPVPSTAIDVAFDDATTSKLYEGAKPAPVTTLNGQPMAKIQAAVREAWPTIKLTDADGKLSPIVVDVETEAGPLEITLFPDLAPNHVRNFLALAQIGYYNGLTFERIVRLDYDNDAGMKQKLEVITAGCPVGDGEPTTGHLGYFLKPETRSLSHEEGVIGFVREDEPASASCRTYFCMSPAAVMDGQFIGFGRVTKGMDVLKTIGSKPVKNPMSYPDNEQFAQPVKIRSVVRR